MTTTTPLNPGWYSDPRDPRSEVYWNGVEWTTTRRPIGGQPLAAAPDPAPSSQAVAGWVSTQSAALVSMWQRAGVGQRIAMGLAAAAVLVAALVGLAKFSADQEIRSGCSRAASYEGFWGDLKDEAVDFCVQYVKDFG